MPSLWKRITFSVASVLCIGSVVLLVVALSTERWITGRILCKTGAEIVNASHPELEQFTGDIYYGLFQGGKTKRCGLGKRRSKIYNMTHLDVQRLRGYRGNTVIFYNIDSPVKPMALDQQQWMDTLGLFFPKLVRTLNSGLHMMVILFLLMAIGFATVSLSFCIYNARKVPYQSVKGHKGLYLWNCIAAFFGSLGVLCFLAAKKHHNLTERVANYGENLFVLVILSDSLDVSFWLGVASIGTHFAVCGVVAMSRIKLPKPEVKKPEEPTISALDMLY